MTCHKIQRFFSPWADGPCFLLFVRRRKNGAAAIDLSFATEPLRKFPWNDKTLSNVNKHWILLCDPLTRGVSRRESGAAKDLIHCTVQGDHFQDEGRALYLPSSHQVVPQAVVQRCRRHCQRSLHSEGQEHRLAPTAAAAIPSHPIAI